MKVFTAKYSGFCPGVVSAERRIFEARKRHQDSPIYVLGYLIHNQTYIDYLAENSVVTVKKAEDAPEKGILVVRTHGINKDLEENLQGRNKLLDLTCPKVKKVQLVIRSHSEKGFFILITGKRDHPEVQGLLSYAEKYEVVENITDLESFINDLGTIEQKKILVISQTTGDEDFFQETRKRVAEAGKDRGISVTGYDSVCSITARREREALKLQDEVDVTFVIGDKMSSNASKLFKILKDRRPETYFVNGKTELKTLGLDFSIWKKAQVVSSSSTPTFLEKEIIEYLESL
jgi:4-hydroxy-3-methylbut-2-enyl diphosphate reductase